MSKIIPFPVASGSSAPATGSVALSWDQTENIYGGIWEVQTACGRVFRKDLGTKRGLGFYIVPMLERAFGVDHRAAWTIAEKSKYIRVESLHGSPQNDKAD